MTVDVQPIRALSPAGLDSSPSRWDPTYCKDWTAAKSSNWHKFRAVDQEWSVRITQRQSTICGMCRTPLRTAEIRRACSLRRSLGEDIAEPPRRVQTRRVWSWHFTMQAQRYGSTQMVNQRDPHKLSYKLRSRRIFTLYLSEIGLDLPGFDIAAGKQHWLEDPVWQGVRKSIESIMGSNDYLEQYSRPKWYLSRWLAQLFRSGFLISSLGAERFHHPGRRLRGGGGL